MLFYHATNVLQIVFIIAQNCQEENMIVCILMRLIADVNMDIHNYVVLQRQNPNDQRWK